MSVAARPSEFTCQDCGHHVIGCALSPPDGPDLCASCDWITRSLAPEYHRDVRARLGVPLKDKA